MTDLERAYTEKINDPELGLTAHQKEVVTDIIRGYEELVKNLETLTRIQERSIERAQNVIHMLGKDKPTMRKTIH